MTTGGSAEPLDRSAIPATSLGIDLSAQPVKTWACVVTWSGAGALTAVDLHSRMTDAALIDLMTADVPVGIDAPFGWPQAFTTALAAYDSQGAWVDGQDVADEAGWSRDLRLRGTDSDVQSLLGLTPLSASSSNLAVCAFRAAGLLARWGRIGGRPLDRTDMRTGVYEVYPAAALACWGLPFRGYKKPRDGRAVREVILDRIFDAIGATDACAEVSPEREQMLAGDHALDAFVSALVARLAALGRTRTPTEQQADAARREGWIHVPSGDLSDLAVALGR